MFGGAPQYLLEVLLAIRSHKPSCMTLELRNVLSYQATSAVHSYASANNGSIMQKLRQSRNSQLLLALLR